LTATLLKIVDTASFVGGLDH